MLKIKNISAGYGQSRVLKDVILDVNNGEIVALVGSNGAGKSTLVKVIFGLVKPTSGKVIFQDQDITDSPVHIRAELGISVVPEGRQVFPKLSVEENLMVGSMNIRARPFRSATMEEVFNRFPRLAERKNQQASTLSGGEQQMLVIGRALMAKPSLLIFDEPSLGLAPKLVDGVFETINELHQEKSLGILLIEQNVARALDLTTRAIVLENGKVTISGNSKDLAKDEHIKRVYLGI